MFQVFCKTIKSRKWVEYSKPFETELQAFNCLQIAINRRIIGTDGHFILFYILFGRFEKWVNLKSCATNTGKTSV